MNHPKIYAHVFRNSMPSEIQTDKVVLIDTHNFTTTAIEALSNGADSIIPLNSLKGGISDEIDVVAGDNNSKLRNHPADMTRDIVKGKTVGINSWNGTKAAHSIRSLDGGDTVYAASLTNAPAIALELYDEDEITFILSGSNGNTPPEDVITMQCIINLINSEPDYAMNICNNYELFYELLVTQIYEQILSWSDGSENKGTPFGNPENHAQDFASQIGSKTITPVMKEESKFH